MFDIGWSELLVIGIVALIAIGPRELPGVLRMVGHWVGKMRRMAADFQNQFNDAMREAEIADLKKQVDDINLTASNFASGFDHVSTTTTTPAADTASEAAVIESAAESAPVETQSSVPPEPPPSDDASEKHSDSGELGPPLEAVEQPKSGAGGAR